MAGLGRVDKCGFIIALVSGWAGRWGLTGKPQATAVTCVCLRFACVSYEGLFFGVLFLIRIILGLSVLCYGRLVCGH